MLMLPLEQIFFLLKVDLLIRRDAQMNMARLLLPLKVYLLTLNLEVVHLVKENFMYNFILL